MGSGGEVPEPGAGWPGGGRVFFDATITPNRSMSPRALRLMLLAVLAYNLVLMAFLLAIGAFPVPVFLGLDFLGLYVAFRVSERRAGAVERVRVTAEDIRVAQGRRGRETEVWRSPTAFTEVAVETSVRETRVSLRISGRSLVLGAGLGADERDAFGAALAAAAARARTARYGS